MLLLDRDEACLGCTGVGGGQQEHRKRVAADAALHNIGFEEADDGKHGNDVRHFPLYQVRRVHSVLHWVCHLGGKGQQRWHGSSPVDAPPEIVK